MKFELKVKSAISVLDIDEWFYILILLYLFQILFLTAKRKYEEVQRRECIPNKKFKILFEDSSVEEAYEALLEHRCRICDRGPLFKSFDSLKNHMSRAHARFPCSLCVEHLKVHVNCYSIIYFMFLISKFLTGGGGSIGTTVGFETQRPQVRTLSSGAQEKLSFSESKMLCWLLECTVPNPCVYARIGMIMLLLLLI